jgi:hypothetical protein
MFWSKKLKEQVILHVRRFIMLISLLSVSVEKSINMLSQNDILLDLLTSVGPKKYQQNKLQSILLSWRKIQPYHIKDWIVNNAAGE